MQSGDELVFGGTMLPGSNNETFPGAIFGYSRDALLLGEYNQS